MAGAEPGIDEQRRAYPLRYVDHTMVGMDEEIPSP
ncbi:hypothetical protein LINPERPRIM_LOCUS36190 [Linum perenne]